MLQAGMVDGVQTIWRGSCWLKRTLGMTVGAEAVFRSLENQTSLGFSRGQTVNHRILLECRFRSS